MVNNFSIFTICTENYKDVIDFVIPSWLKLGSVDNIYIYTDFDLVYNDDRVIVLNKIKKTDDWLEIVGLKAVLLGDFLNIYNNEYFVFIDIDCYITKDIVHVFDNNFDIAATRMYNNGVANSGVWFCRNNLNINKFCNEWVQLQKVYKQKKIGIKKYCSSYGQISFSDILHREHKNKSYLKVLPINAKKYNYENDDADIWIKDMDKYKPYIVHYKGRRWRNKLIFDKSLIKLKEIENE